MTLDFARNSPLRTLTMAALIGLTVSARAQLVDPSKPKPQDTTGAMAGYDMLGVKLGMSEADAVAAIRKRFPDGSPDAMGRPMKIKQTDYMLVNPSNRQPVRAGVRFELRPEQKSNYDFIKLLVHDGKVWAVWRDDMSSKYDYDKMVGELTTKYAAARPIESMFDVIEGTKRTSDGSKGTSGVELYDGKCTGTPLSHMATDSIALQPGCNKVLWVNYSITKTAGVKSIGAGGGQLVDLEAGRMFFASMNNAATAKAQSDNKRGGDAKL
ncbi:hypothetical protein [Methylibium rhizosphaerae]|uniref:hypothetical protein n=1 Tax=Methylibium rhizosphaerae TaxID=2570323 RepID=UPI00112DDE03|nr:hypothetical protein [Methylibium rhizosphaerae]